MMTYEKPEVQVIEFVMQEAIATSVGGNTGVSDSIFDQDTPGTVNYNNG